MQLITKHAAYRINTVLWGLCSLGVWGCSSPETVVQDVDVVAARPPNIVLILADDLGWADVGYNGSTLYETPNIDALARRGLRFTNFYAAAPICSPTRASIMTGKAPARLGITEAAGHLKPLPGVGPHFATPDPNLQFIYPRGKRFLEPDEYTLAEALRDAGYATAHIGKWHLGVRPEHWPEQQGFDVSFHGAPDPGPADTYFAPYHFAAGTVTDGPDGEYITDRITDEAIEFMRENQGRPFFLYLTEYAVHAPWQAKKELADYYQGKADSSSPQHNPVVAGMIGSLDESVGRVLKALDEMQIADDTVVVFTSDNGGLLTIPRRPSQKIDPDGSIPTRPIETADGNVVGVQVRRVGGVHITSNAPLRGGKGDTYEGGLRVPAIFLWPGVTGAGSVCDTPAVTTDLYRTLLEIAQVELRDTVGQDGTSIVRLLEGARGLDRDTLYWHFPHAGTDASSVVREGDFKWIDFYEGPDELYDLANDLGEENNLAQAMPEQGKAMQEKLERWLDGVAAVRPRPAPAKKQTMSELIQALDWGEWRGIHDCTFEVTGGALVVTTTGMRPILVARVRNQGNPVVRLRMQTSGTGPGGKGWIFWSNAQFPNFSGSRRVEFPVIPDGEYHEYSIPLRAEHGVTGLRLDLGESATPIRFDWVRLAQINTGEVVQSWEFDEE